MIRLIPLLLLSSVANAATYNMSWTAPTARADSTPITGEITYKVYGGPVGNVGSAPLEETTDTTANGTIDLPNNSGEFYIVACENNRCGEESQRVIATCNTAFIGPIVLNVNLECN